MLLKESEAQREKMAEQELNWKKDLLESQKEADATKTNVSCWLECTILFVFQGLIKQYYYMYMYCSSWSCSGYAYVIYQVEFAIAWFAVIENKKCVLIVWSSCYLYDRLYVFVDEICEAYALPKDKVLIKNQRITSVYLFSALSSLKQAQT